MNNHRASYASRFLEGAVRTSLSFVRSRSPLFVSPLFVLLTLPLLLPRALRGQSTNEQTDNGQTASPRPAYTTDTSIDYTGNLLGYYRMEPTEQTAILPPVKKFLDEYRASNPNSLLIGMGDNFGPEFGASLQLENDADKECMQDPKDTGDGETRPESLYKDDDRVPKLPQCDNVLNFLMQAGFRAVVPGRNDFMYTARWLRTATVRLARASQAQGGSPLINNYDHQLYLLAANLRIQFKGSLHLRHQGSPDPPYSLNGHCPLLFSNDPFAPDSPLCGESGLSEPIDWLDRLDSVDSTNTNGQNPTFEAMQQLASDAATTAAGRDTMLKLLVGNEIDIMQSAWGSYLEVKALTGKPGPGEGAGGTGKRTSKSEDESSGGKQLDLSAQSVSDLISRLKNLPECQTGAKFADDAETRNAGDLCTYRTNLQQILQNFSDQLSASQQNKTIAACPVTNGTSSLGACFVLSDQARQAATNGLLRTIAKEQKNVGYTVATKADGEKILVIGVVGQNTMKEVSETNLRMCVGLDGKPGKDDTTSLDAIQNPDSVLDGVHWPAEFGICYLRTSAEVEQKGLSATAVATDPVVVSAELVRAAELVEGRINGVVLMAQMPHTEAEVLAARVWERLATSPAQRPINIVISEAGETETGTDAITQETGYDTPDLTLNYAYHGGDRNAVNTGHPPPVLTPFNGYPDPPNGRFPGAISRATIEWTQGEKLVITNKSTGIYPQNAPVQPAQGGATSASANTPSTNTASTNTASTTTDSVPETAIQLLYDLMAKIEGKSATYSDNPNNEQKAELALLADLQQATEPFFKGLPQAGATRQHADVVLLQSRDVQLGLIGKGYQNYDVCDNELIDPKIKAEDRQEKFQLCKLRVALDRIFWKGDYLEYVAVKGQDIETILNKSDALVQQQNELTETDTSQEWLVSYGIVQSSLSNPTLVNQNNEPLWIPVDPTCAGESAGKSTYCIAQTPIVNDAYYWLVTTDQLAEDRSVYGTFDALPSTNHVETETFITAPISHYLLNSLGNTRLASVITSLPHCAASGAIGSQSQGAGATAPPPCSVEGAIATQNESFQQRRLFQVDFAKLIAGFTARQPVGGNANVANFQGISNSQATAPASQDLDLETGSRILADLRVPDASSSLSAQNRFPWSVGLQSSFTYNRQVLGNLLNKPINASYSLNNWTEGPFLQVRLYGKGKGSQVRGVRSLPRTLLVFTPHQYQIEVDHPYLFFSFAASAPPAGNRTELTVQLPRTTGWTDQAGLRVEFGQSSQKAFFWNGSYIQTGLEFSTQNGQLASITLQDGPTGTPKTCPVSATVTLQNCFSTADSEGPALPINGSTMLSGPPLAKSLHTPGYYWEIYLQNRLPQFLGKSPDRQISLVTNTTGDYYFGRTPSAELASQTEYAIPLSLSLVLPAVGNLSFAPNYSAFFYRPQLSPHSLIENSWTITARWYFARDARVPIRRQAPLKGPESSDQTKTGSSH